MKFEEALEQLKLGKMLAREVWREMYIFIVPGNVIEQSIADHYNDCARLPVPDTIYLKTADDELVPWATGQSDILASDWNVV
jgi:hypothetical protein